MLGYATLLFLLCYRRVYTVRSWGEPTILDSFGFRTGSTYQLNLTDLNASSVFIALCTPNERKLLKRSHSLCSLGSFDYPLIADHVTVSGFSAAFQGTIEAPGVLHPLISVCGQSPVSYTVSVFFDNGSSLLDSRAIPYLVLAPFSLAAFGCLTVWWYGSWIARRRARNSLHADFRWTLLSTVLFCFFDYWELAHSSRSDEDSSVTFARILLETVHAVCFLTMELILAAGVSLVRIDVPASDRLRALVTSSCVVVPPAVLDVWRAPRQPFKFECVSTFIGLRLYFLLKLFQRFNSAMGLLLWDTRVLSEDEIAAKAGALQRFRACFGRSFGYAVALMTLWSVDDIGVLAFWISRFIQDGIWFVALSDFAWISGRQPATLGLDGDGWPSSPDMRSWRSAFSGDTLDSRRGGP
jgi:hypothetical protein